MSVLRRISVVVRTIFAVGISVMITKTRFGYDTTRLERSGMCMRSKSATPRRAARQAKPLLDAFHTWAVAQRRRLSSKMPLGKAFQYSLSRWDALTRYTEDGRLSIDNNYRRGFSEESLSRERTFYSWVPIVAGPAPR